MKNKIYVSAIVLTMLTVAGCKKNGLGGTTKLIVTMRHHGTIIVNKANYPDTVFVKFNTVDFPGSDPAGYHTYFIGKPGEDIIHVEGLRPGKYFFYGVGMDITGPYRVKGGSPIEITNKERKNTIAIDLSVTE